MKKILACLFCLILGLAQISYASELYMNYDFSDEAQAEFDRQFLNQPQQQPIEIPIEQKNQLKQDRHIIKRGESTLQLEYPVELNLEENYVLPEIQGTRTFTTSSQGNYVTIPQGNILNVKLQSGISSGSLDVNDAITAALAQNWEYKGQIFAPAGSIVYGTVTDVDTAGYAYGSGELEITFNRVTTPEGISYDISTQPIKIASKSERAKYMTRDTLIGAAIGILAAIVGSSLSGGDNWGRNMAILGGAGAAAGILRGSMQRGQDASIQANTVLQLILTKPVNAAVYQPL